jgi:hypothetical protein
MPLEFPLSPMGVLTRGIKHPLDKAVLESQSGNKGFELERTSDVSDGLEFWSTPFEKQTP